MATAAPRPPSAGIDFARSFTFIGEDPDWLKKLLIGGAFALACGLLVGIPFVLGYFSRTLSNVAKGTSPALPEWDDLGGLFEEGLRLTVVYLVHVLGVVVVLGAAGAAVLLPMLAASSGSKPSDALAAFGALGIAALYAGVLGLSLVMAVYLPAPLARAALRGNVGDAFAWRENIAFITANLANYALALVSYLLASFVAQFGVLLCCVGVFPAAFWSYLVLASALGQTARLSPRAV
jgi:quinol-cytochrome oxidoreductase complex cytochrome b subunit